jgi:MFS family permease
MATQPNPYQPPQSQLWPAGAPGPVVPTFDDAPIAVFQFNYGENWFRQAFDRWWKLQRPYGLNRAGWIVSAIVSFYMAGIFSERPDRFNLESWKFWGLAVMIFIVGGLGLVWFAKWRSRLNSILILRRLKEFDQPTTFTVFREGFVSSNHLSTTMKRWAAFQSAVRYTDGVLLNVGLTQFYWLPFGDLTAGKVDDIDALMSANFADYQQRRG